MYFSLSLNQRHSHSLMHTCSSTHAPHTYSHPRTWVTSLIKIRADMYFSPSLNQRHSHPLTHSPKNMDNKLDKEKGWYVLFSPSISITMTHTHSPAALSPPHSAALLCHGAFVCDLFLLVFMKLMVLQLMVLLSERLIPFPGLMVSWPCLHPGMMWVWV
jgi:hypothetical protein